MKTRVCVLGGQGFIGSYVIEKCLKNGFEVISFDRYKKDKKSKNGLSYFMGDIRDRETVQQVVNRADIILNLCGILGTQETIDDPIPSIQTNTIGAVNFLHACIPTKFHQVKGVQIGVGNYFEQNSYSISKSTAIRFCKMYNKEHGTRVAMVRAYNAYGPRQKHKPVRKIIPTFVMRALKGENIEVYGSGDQVMDMIHAKDVARILVDACIKDHGNYSTVFEAGTGRETTVNWIADKVVKECKSKSKIIHIPMRPGEGKKAIVMANSKVNTLMECIVDSQGKVLEPLYDKEFKFIPFEEGIKETVEWYRKEFRL